MTGSDTNHEVIFGAGGADTLSGLGGDDALAGGLGDDDIDGGDGADELADWVLADIYDQAPVEGPLTVDLVAGTLTGLGTDTLVSVEGSHGTPAADVMIGNDLDNGFTQLIRGR